MVGVHTKKSWQRFVSTEHEYLVNDEAIDLLESLLKIDHMERITAREALNHKYFSSVRRKSTNKSTSSMLNKVTVKET